MKIYSLQKHIFETFTGNMQIYMISNHLKNVEKNSMHTKIMRKRSKNMNRNSKGCNTENVNKLCYFLMRLIKLKRKNTNK